MLKRGGKGFFVSLKMLQQQWLFTCWGNYWQTLWWDERRQNTSEGGGRRLSHCQVTDNWWHLISSTMLNCTSWMSSQKDETSSNIHVTQCKMQKSSILVFFLSGWWNVFLLFCSFSLYINSIFYHIHFKVWPTMTQCLVYWKQFGGNYPCLLFAHTSHYWNPIPILFAIFIKKKLRGNYFYLFCKRLV